MDAFRLSLAGPEDVRELSLLVLKAIIEEGDPPFVLEPRSAYWDVMNVRGDEWKVILARRVNDGDCVGFCSVARRSLHVGGAPLPVSFVYDLFLDSSARSGVLLKRGNERLREEAFPEGAIGQCIMMENNTRALRVFTMGRGRMPGFYPAGKLAWHYIGIGGPDPRQASEIEVRRADTGDLGAMQDFHDEWAPTRELYPRYEFSRLGQPYYRNLAPKDYFLAFRHGRLAGMAGIWDQSGFRNKRYFKEEGGEVILVPAPPSLYIHSLLVENNAPEVADHLVAAIRAEVAQSGFEKLVLTLDVEDPLRSGLVRHSGFYDNIRHYLVSYDGDPRPRLRKGPFYFEWARS